MTLIKRAYFRFKALLFGASKRQDLEDEMQSHLDMRIEEHITSGMSPEEARNAALKEFGGVEQIKEECIDSWGVRIANDLLQDIHFGFRQILKHKGFTAVVILTLALCIGANTVIFSVINSIFFKPYPFPDVDRLVLIWNKFPQVGIDKYVNQKVHYLERTRDTTVFEDLALINIESYNIEISGSLERARGMRVTPSFFPTLKIQPFLGRSFTERETDIGNEKVAILSYGLWQRMYGGEETAIGKIIPLNGEGYTIVGIMPDSYQLPSRKVDLWTPIILTPKTLSPGDRIVESDNYEYEMIGRLKSSETLISAQREIDLVNERNMQLYPNSYKLEIKSGFGSTVVGFHDDVIGEIRPALYLLQGGAVLVLLIGCVNISSLLLSRFNVRLNELAMRFSLGACRMRITRQLLTESVILSLIGGTIGLLLAFVGVRSLALFGIDHLPRGSDVLIDGKVLLYSALLTIIAGLIFGSIPVLQLLKTDHKSITHRVELTASSGRSATFIRASLVVSEVSMAFILLIGTGLLVRSFIRILAVDPGFDDENVLTARILLPGNRYDDWESVREFSSRAVNNIQTLPGVDTAATTVNLPFGWGVSVTPFNIEGYALAADEPDPITHHFLIDENYFQTMGIPLFKGRNFNSRDTENNEKVVIIDQKLAKKYWGDEDPIGKKITSGFIEGYGTIIGIVDEIKVNDLSEQTSHGAIYINFIQEPRKHFYLAIKTELEPEQLVETVRNEILKLDPNLPVFDIKSMKSRIEESTINRKAPMLLLSLFTGIALFLSALGLYGVLANSVNQQTKEIGIRMALGAERFDVLWRVLRYGLKLTCIGLGIGLIGAFFLSQLIESLLFEVTPTDPWVYALVIITLVGAAIVASLIPALKATRIDPLLALRYE